tara:strand:- start:140 stop:1084 length:945 start_codon:yes stop_codon:yes gene_type:complete
MLAGVGLLMVCCSSSSAAAMMMGREEKEDPVVPKTPAKKSPEQIKADEAKAVLDELLAGGLIDGVNPPTADDILDARNEAENAQAAADAAADTDTDTDAADTPPPPPPPPPPDPINCVGSWPGWGACNEICGGGLQSRTWTTTTAPQHGGTACPSPSTQSQACSTQACIETVLSTPNSRRSSSGVTGTTVPGTDTPGNGFNRGRLDSPAAWSAWPANYTDWYQLDNGVEARISGVAIKGRATANEWVTKFSVKSSSNGSTWVNVDGGKVFTGNTDRNTQVNVKFDTPVNTRYIRIYPKAISGYMSLRADLIRIQ